MRLTDRRSAAMSAHSLHYHTLTPGGRTLQVLRVLVVEDNEADALIVGQMLAASPELPTAVERRATLTDSLARLEAGGIDLVLLDLMLPDSRGLETFARLRSTYPNVLVIVLSSSDDETLALDAIRGGAQDYFIKGSVTAEVVRHRVRYAQERHRLMLAERQASRHDDLTGLLNRRGFLGLAAVHREYSRGPNVHFLLLLGDLDGLKQINDSFGHATGDRAIQAAARVLRSACRSNDVVARLGGDEFAALLVESTEMSPSVLIGRVAQRFAAFNATSELSFEVNLTAGAVAMDAGLATPIEAFLAEADAELYARKRGRRTALKLKSG